MVVNCYMGLSRSASCVLAYLITKQGMSPNKALDFVKESRAVRPNEGFLNQLRDLERSVSRDLDQQDVQELWNTMIRARKRAEEYRKFILSEDDSYSDSIDYEDRYSAS